PEGQVGAGRLIGDDAVEEAEHSGQVVDRHPLGGREEAALVDLRGRSGGTSDDERLAGRETVVDHRGDVGDLHVGDGDLPAEFAALVEEVACGRVRGGDHPLDLE